MKKEDKKNSIKFWDEHAETWQKKAYDKKREYLNFPVSQLRQDITVQKIEELAGNKNVSIIDFGCADGELVRTFLKKGFANVRGIDNSAKMIETAKKILKKEMPGVNPDIIFSVGDADKINKKEKFDFISAMGLIEYLLNLDDFFKNLNHILKPNGIAFIESRNKFFNLFSANKFTSESKIKNLVEELKDAKKFSKIKDEREIAKIISETFVSIGEDLNKFKFKSKAGKRKKFANFPFQLPQFTPGEIESLCKRHRLKIEYVVYYHCHPFLPKFEDDFPAIFNKISLLMQPLGYTSLGATTCSSFIALIKKQ